MPSLHTTLAIGAALVGFAVTIALGMWQLRRAAEKTALDQTWDAAQIGAPLVLHTAADVAAVAASLPRRVRVGGEFDYPRTYWLDNRPLAGRAGFLVVTPLRLDGTQQVVLVNRGWAARDPGDRTRLPAIGRPAGSVEIEGIAVADMPRVFDLGEQGAGVIRQNLDGREVESEIGMPVAHFVIQQTSALDDALDRHWTPPASGAERNRGYAFQWFALATLIALLPVVFGLRALRARSGVGRA